MIKHLCLVLFNIPLDQTSGSCTYVRGLSHLLCSQGYKITILTNQLSKLTPDLELLKTQVNIIELPTERLFSRSSTFTETNKDKLDTITQLYIQCLEKIHASVPIDLLIFQHLAGSNILAKYFKEKHKINSFAVAHGTDLHELKDHPHRNDIFSNLNTFEKIICPSEKVFQNIVGLFGDDIKNKCLISYPGINDIFLNPLKIYDYAGRNNILIVGRLIHEKGIIEGIEIFEKLHHNYPSVKLTIIGSGHLSTYINQTYKSYIEKGIINLLGDTCQHTVSKYMQQSRLLLFTATWDEPFGMVVTEAMASSIPIIARKVGVIHNLLGNEYQYIAHDDDDLYNMALKLYYDQLEREGTSTYLNARSKKFTRESTNSHLLENINLCIS